MRKLVKGKLKFSYILFLFIAIIFSPNLYAEEENVELDKNIKNLSFSGFFRTRLWHFQSKNVFPGSFEDDITEKYVTYQDLFLRNRFLLKVSSNIEIKTVFDIFTVFGESVINNIDTKGGALGSAGINLKTRNLYLTYALLSQKMQFALGLQPFSLPGGYILASDGTGIKMSYDIFKGFWNSYIYYIKAYDNSKENFGEGFGNYNFNDNDIYVWGSKTSFNENYSLEFYYVYQKDLDLNYDADWAKLNWVGCHNKFFINKYFIELALIYNSGKIREKTDDSANNETTNVKAGLFDLWLGFRYEALEFALKVKGATGNITHRIHSNSFQDIRASNSFTSLIIDNTGGLSYRGSLYGILGQGIEIKYAFSNFELLTRYVHFRTANKINIQENKKSNYFGDEYEIQGKYNIEEYFSIFINGAVFNPNEAYTSIMQTDNKNHIYEFMIGGRVDY
ncbi:MAG: hypothetical protein OEZ22_08240 [Spirochaetia bacterium]|nr:hypothetical protein [Spirochaetia bacterium]